MNSLLHNLNFIKNFIKNKVKMETYSEKMFKRDIDLISRIIRSKIECIRKSMYSNSAYIDYELLFDNTNELCKILEEYNNILIDRYLKLNKRSFHKEILKFGETLKTFQHETRETIFDIFNYSNENYCDTSIKHNSIVNAICDDIIIILIKLIECYHQII